MATSALFDAGRNKILSGTILPTSDTLKVSLHTSSYVPNVATHAFYTDLTNELPTANGYTAGGVALANKSITTDTTNHRAYLDADDSTWSASGTLTYRYAVLRKDTGVGATSPIIGYIDFGVDRSVLNGEQNIIQWSAPASGAILYL